MIRVTRQIKYIIAQAQGVIPHPLPEVNFLMVEIPTPMCQVSIFWHCWFTRRFLNIEIINHFRLPLWTADIPNITLEEEGTLNPRNIWAFIFCFK
jgi:hypothetical protein